MHASCARVSLKPWRLSLSQDADDNEWKWETTQNLQREFLSKLFNISSKLHAHPDAVSSYEDLREHLDAHCNRVFNGVSGRSHQHVELPKVHFGGPGAQIRVCVCVCVCDSIACAGLL